MLLMCFCDSVMSSYCPHTLCNISEIVESMTEVKNNDNYVVLFQNNLNKKKSMAYSNNSDVKIKSNTYSKLQANAFGGLDCWKQMNYDRSMINRGYQINSKQGDNMLNFFI